MTEPTAIQPADTRTSGVPYTLLASETTVRVLSPTVSSDVLYCTISTLGHGVIASMPIAQGTFESVNSSAVLTFFAQGIEEVMRLDHVIAGVGTQSIDANSLIVDNLAFTVEYVPPDATTTTAVTAEAVVPVAAVMGPSTVPGRPGIAEAQAIIDAVYADLQRLAGG